ncbi:hypothetical protein B0H12DRAFT_1323849 [Mycena haematopus]|nr:hypothetical protein B0H12DRAFT_1323849 [Mycena haematopus]
MATRAAQRKQRLLELENEQRIEDAEALKFTDEQRLSLFLSFRSVKFEWSDLDGMRSVRRRYNSSCPASPSPVRSLTHSLLSPARPPALQPPSSEAFAVLTNARLATFGKDDTIRGYASAPFPTTPERYCSTPTPYDSAPRYESKYEYEYASAPATPPPMVRSVSSPPALVPTPPVMRRSPSISSPSPKSNKTTPRGKRRSPVKGLFSVSASSAANCVQPIRVPLPPLVSSASIIDEAEDDDDEGAWVDEDDLTVTADDDWEGRDADGLVTPVPASGWRLGTAQPPALRFDCIPPALRVDIGAPPAYDEELEPATPVPCERAATPTPPFIRVSDEAEAAHAGEKRKR